MKYSNSLKNILFGFINLTITATLGIIIPRLFLVNFGSEVNGLMSSINQIFAYFSILEAGVGLATLQSLYKPISEKDNYRMNKILSATNKYYKKSSLMYFFTLLIFAIIYPLLVASPINKYTIVCVILLTGISGVLNFLFQGKYKILLEADGKSYIFINLNTVIHILINISKIFLLLKGFNIIAIQATLVFFNILQIIYINLYIKNNYKWIDLSVEPDYKSISQKKSVLIHQISGIIFNNTDIIILSFFTNLKVVSVYSIYNMIFIILNKFIGFISNGVTFAFGQLYDTDKSMFIKYFNIYEAYYTSIIFSISTVAMIFVNPFMELYTAGITDINYCDRLLPTLFIVITLLLVGRAPSRQVINIAGHFKKTQNRSIFESFINLTSSLIFVRYYGIYGVLIGTIIALLYRTNDMIIYSNRVILNRSLLNTYKNWVINVLAFLLVIYLNNCFNLKIFSYLSLIGWSLIYFLIILIFFICLTSLTNRDLYKQLTGMIKNNIKNRK